MPKGNPAAYIKGAVKKPAKRRRKTASKGKGRPKRR